MLLASAVPAMTNTLSLVLPPLATVPVIGSMSSVIEMIVGGNSSRSSVKGLAKPTTPLSPSGAVPPQASTPQETTVPSLFRAAKAKPLEKIWVTPPSPAGVVPPQSG